MNAIHKLIVLEKLQGNPPAGQLGIIQSMLAPWLSQLETAFWCLWFGTLLFMIIRYLIPTLARGGNSQP